MAGGVRQAAAGEVARRKSAVRAEVRRRLAALEPSSFTPFAHAVFDRLLHEPQWLAARSILAYSALGRELDLWPVLEHARAAGKTVALPRYEAGTGRYCAAIIPEDPAHLAKAAYGILEPPASAPCLALNRLDFVLVPGVAFDLRGTRLGRGKGFYDQLLAQVEGIKCGVALDQQIVEELPAESHDIAMNLILTPTRRLVVPSGGS